jgi:hypothetical protein
MGIKDIFLALAKIGEEMFQLHEEGRLTQEHLAAVVDAAVGQLHAVDKPKEDQP